jgi:hypothetical protein
MPLNVIISSCYQPLIWLDFDVLNDYYVAITGYCKHSVNIITFSLAPSDHIKRLPLKHLDVI